MPEPVEADCTICPSSRRAKERFVAAEVVEHIEGKARRDASHRTWIEEHTTNGTLAEIREALTEHGRPRQ